MITDYIKNTIISSSLNQVYILFVGTVLMMSLEIHLGLSTLIPTPSPPLLTIYHCNDLDLY